MLRNIISPENDAIIHVEMSRDMINFIKKFLIKGFKPYLKEAQAVFTFESELNKFSVEIFFKNERNFKFQDCQSVLNFNEDIQSKEIAIYIEEFIKDISLIETSNSIELFIFPSRIRISSTNEIDASTVVKSLRDIDLLSEDILSDLQTQKCVDATKVEFVLEDDNLELFVAMFPLSLAKNDEDCEFKLIIDSHSMIKFEINYPNLYSHMITMDNDINLKIQETCDVGVSLRYSLVAVDQLVKLFKNVPLTFEVLLDCTMLISSTINGIKMSSFFRQLHPISSELN